MVGTIARRAAGAAVAVALATGLAACGRVSYVPAQTPSTVPGTVAVPTTPPTAGPTVTSPGPATSTPTPTTGRPTATATPSAPVPTTPTTPTRPPRTDLRAGDSGPRVLALQQRLRDLGYWLGEPDGQFGDLTLQAVWAVQKAAGLSRDGSVGPATRGALDAGVRPRARLSGDGVEIDLERQLLLVVRGGHVELVLNTSTGGGYEYEASDGGTAVARTPRGTFTVFHTVDGPDTGRLGTLWRPRYFNGGIAVHGAPSVPPWPASHGCARVSNAAMDMVWARGLMPLGSTVLVR